MEYQCKKPITLYADTGLFKQAGIGLQWLWNCTGKAATNHYESGAFVRSAAGIEHPDIQFHFLPVCFTDKNSMNPTEHGFRVHAGSLRSQSRGHVKLRSADPLEPPIIDPNYMSTDADWNELRACVSLAREIFHQSALILTAVKKSGLVKRSAHNRLLTISFANMRKAAIIHAEPVEWAMMQKLWLTLTAG